MKIRSCLVAVSILLLTSLGYGQSSRDSSVKLTGTGGIPTSLAVFSAFVNFGTVTVGSRVDSFLQIANILCDTVYVQALELSGSFIADTAGISIAPGNTGRIRISFRPVNAGQDTQRLILRLKEHVVVIDTAATLLIGIGVANSAGVSGQVEKPNFSIACYPNPASNSLRVSYAIPACSDVRLSMIDASGREVFNFTNSDESAGEHTAVVNTAKLPSGNYLCRMIAVSDDGQVCSQSQMVVIEH